MSTSETNKRKSEASRLFTGGKSALNNFPELRWMFEPVGMNLDQALEWASLCVSKRYEVELNLKEIPLVQFAQRSLHNDEFVPAFREEMFTQVKLGVFTTDKNDEKYKKKYEKTDNGTNESIESESEENDDLEELEDQEENIDE